MIKTSSLILLIIVSNTFSAFEISHSPAAGYSPARSGMFGAYIVNPAFLHFTRPTAMGISFQSLYNLPELKHGQIAANMSFGGMRGGVHFSTLGDNIYKESKFSLNMGRSFYAQKLYLALCLNYFSISAAGDFAVSASGLDFGAVYQVHEKIHAGYSIRNMNQPDLNGHPSELPVANVFSLITSLSDEFLVDLSLVKEDSYPISVIFGSHLLINERLEFISAFITDPATPIVGINLNIMQLQINYTLRYHFDLGATHLWSMMFFGK